MTPEEAIKSYLGAHVALRDAKRLLEMGTVVATEEATTVISSVLASDSLSIVLQATLANEAKDLVDLYGQDPEAYPDGRTADLALNAATSTVLKRYRNGKCTLCEGPALPCAKRHARGRSCV